MMLPLGVSGLTGVAGEPVTPGPTVLATDGSTEGGGAPVVGATVHFVVTGPSGGAPVTVTTDAKGLARFDNWVLAPGDNTLEARGLGLGTVPTKDGFLSLGVVRFTATGLVLFGVNASDDGLSKIDPASGVVTFINRLDPVTTVFTTPVAMAVRPSTHAIYVWNNSDLVSTGELLTVDVCTGLGTKVSPATPPQGDLQALAFAPNGALYGLDTDLWAVNPVTGVKTLIGSLGQRRVGGADFIGGKLYAFTFGDSLATVDTSTAALTLIGPLSVVVGTPGSIVFNPSTGKLLGSAFGGTSGNILFDIDPATAAVSNIRSLTGGFAPQGLGFAPPCPP